MVAVLCLTAIIGSTAGYLEIVVLPVVIDTLEKSSLEGERTGRRSKKGLKLKKAM